MNGNDKPRLTDLQKKQNHIESEKKRREAIRKGFDRLSEIVPGMEGSGRSEAVVLQATVTYLRGQIKKKEELRKQALARGMTNAQFDNAYKGVEDAADEADAASASGSGTSVKKE